MRFVDLGHALYNLAVDLGVDLLPQTAAHNVRSHHGLRCRASLDSLRTFVYPAWLGGAAGVSAP